MNKHKEHPFLPVTRVVQGQHNLDFEGSFDDNAPVSRMMMGVVALSSLSLSLSLSLSVQIGSKSTEKGDCIVL